MKQTALATLILIFFASSVYGADYEVTIDGNSYMFTQGVTQDIILKGGKSVSISVSAVKTKVFQDYGISFNYPSDMTIGQDSFYGIKQITLQATDSTLVMLQIFPSEAAPREVQSDLLAGFREEYSNLGVRFPANSTSPCKRTIGGVEREGIQLSYALGALAHETEIYTMQKDGKTLAMVFQCAVEDKDKATPRYEVVTSTFK